MSSVYISFPDWLVTGALCAFLGFVIFAVVIFMTLGVSNVQRIKRREKWSTAQKDLVIVHQLIRGKKAPSVVPFALKLETYLRMAGIPYENDFEEPMGSKGKCPWITINGEDFTDSQIIIERLQQQFHKDMSSQLSPVEHSQGRAFQVMLEDHFYWALVLFRQKFKPLSYIQSLVQLPFYVILLSYFWRRRYQQAAVKQGMGRHSEEEVIKMTEDDLKAFSNFLGTKKFLLGDQPSEYDCACFGILAQVVWCFPNTSYEALAFGDLSNIRDYCFRMKERFWPDWNSCLNS